MSKKLYTRVYKIYLASRPVLGMLPSSRRIQILETIQVMTMHANLMYGLYTILHDLLDGERI